MILGKLWHTLMAQINKIANIFWTADPIAQMQYEYDQAVAQLKEGREGLEQYRALVERVGRQAAMDKQHVAKLEAQSRPTSPRATARRPPVSPWNCKKPSRTRPRTKANSSCTKRPTTTTSPRSSTPAGSSSDVREKIQKYDAELKMSRAEAEMAKLATDFNFDVTTDFGQIEQVINDKIGLNRAKVRVAADLSSDGLADIQHEQAMEKALGEQALKDFEVQMGLVTPETAKVTEAAKELGPAAKTAETRRRSEHALDNPSLADFAVDPVTSRYHRACHAARPRRPARRRNCPPGIRPGRGSWPICTFPAPPACSSCTATSTT